MEITSIIPDYTSNEEWSEVVHLVRTGGWFENYFRLKFMDGNLPGLHDTLIGSRLRVQIDTPHEGWKDWKK